MEQQHLKLQQDIIDHSADPIRLEQMYQSDRAAFRHAFDAVYGRMAGQPMASFWHARLHHRSAEPVKVETGSWLQVLAFALVAAFIAKIPAIFGVDEEFFYTRFTGFIVFPVLAGYFIWRNGSTSRNAIIAGAVMLAGLVLIGFLPNKPLSDTLNLVCIHLPLLLWSVLGFVFVGNMQQHNERRLTYLKYNGDLVVMTALMALAFGIMTGLTIGLFSLIGLRIEDFYMKWIALCAAAGAPVVATHLTQVNPQLVGRISPLIARIFSPLVLIMLVIYLVAMTIAGKSPFTDREFLMVFNGLLIGVMAIIFFSVSDQERNRTQAEMWILALLTVVTIIVNGVALSAILIRIAQWGITPNRAAVLGGNALIFINLILVAIQWWKVLREQASVGSVGAKIGQYLPVYVIWTAIVTFLFPLIFGI